MDKSLDEIISSRPKGRRGAGRRSSARAQVLGKPAVTPVQRARATAATPATDTAKAVVQLSEKIIVSNLPDDVNEAQIRELFHHTVGPTKGDILLNFDAHGRSKGTATVTFVKKGDGNKAYQQYNNRLIDGKRPMKIEIVVDLSKPLPLASRVTPAPAATNGVQTPTSRVGGGRARRIRGKGSARKADRAPKSAADLDAEMEDYTASNGPAVAA